VTSGKPITTLSDPGGLAVMALAFTPDGTTIITADIEAKNDAYLWNAATYRLEAELPDPAGYINVLGASLSPDGKILAVAAAQGQYVYDRLWQLATRRLVKTFTGAQGQGAIALAFSPDGKILATGDADGQTYLWAIG
jgi:WD40 repeat protein